MAFLVELYFMLIKFYNFNILANKYCVGYLYMTSLFQCYENICLQKTFLVYLHINKTIGKKKCFTLCTFSGVGSFLSQFLCLYMTPKFFLDNFKWSLSPTLSGGPRYKKKKNSFPNGKENYFCRSTEGEYTGQGCSVISSIAQWWGRELRQSVWKDRLEKTGLDRSFWIAFG